MSAVVASATIAEVEDALGDEAGVLRVPALVKGRLVLAPPVGLDRLRAVAARDPQSARFALEEAYVIRQPLRDAQTLALTGEEQFLLFPRVAAHDLVERDVGALARDLYDLPFAQVTDYVSAVRRAVHELQPILRRMAASTKAASAIHHAMVDIAAAMLDPLLDPAGLTEAVDRELGGHEAPGTRYLDGWVAVPARSHAGPAARLARRILPATTNGAPPASPVIRATPTRQLHITAGNAPIIPLVSAVRAFATKSAAVVKSPAEATAAAAALGMAMHRADPDHPLTRHTSLLYWPGGDRRLEDALLAPGAFDRIVVWGSDETLASVRERSGSTETVFLRPRIGVSMIGRQALGADVEATAGRAVADSMASNQRACTASLIHYVEGSQDEALAYCGAVRAALSAWDRAVPHAVSRADLGRLRRLRRGPLLSATWFENGRWPDTTSAVVLLDAARVDLSAHPMSRLILVRRVDDLAEAAARVHSGVSTVGVAPERRRTELRDELAARGVSNILPLGDCERAYPGMPHDGMRVISRLVNWSSA